MLTPKAKEFPTDESAREEPGYGDPRLSGGEIVDKQISELEAAVGGFGVSAAKVEPTPEPEASKELPQATEPEEEPEQEAEGEEEEPEEELEPEEAEPTEELEEEFDDDEDEPEGDDPQIVALQAQVDVLQQMLQGQQTSVEPIQPQPVPASAFNIEEPVVPMPSEEEFEKIISSPAAFVEFVEKAVDAGKQSMYLQIPGIISSTQAAVNMVDRYFVDNADLKPVEVLVKNTAIGLQRVTPSLSSAEAMQQAGNQIRGYFATAKPKAPAGPKKRGSRRRKNKKAGKAFAKSTAKRAGGPTVAPPQAEATGPAGLAEMEDFVDQR